MTCSFRNFTFIIIHEFKHTFLVVNTVPSQPPTAFQLTASSSTSITASWQLPPVFARHGNIAGFKLFYKKKGSAGSATTLTISDGATLNRTVSGLNKYTEYEFQVLAFTSDGDGPKSSVKVKRTMEDGMWQSRDNEKNCEPYFFGFASSLWVYWICTNLIVGELNNWINWLLSFTKTQQHLHSCGKLRCDRSFQKFLQLIKNTTAQLQLLHNLHLTSV